MTNIQGQTVMGLVSSSLAKGLRENGFRVLEESAAEYAAAAPIGVDIEKFWGWFRPQADEVDTKSLVIHYSSG